MLLLFFGLLAFMVLAVLIAVASVGVTLASLATLVTAPGQLLRLVRDRQLRRNHAFEHATINVIEERYGPSNLAGLAQSDGFIIRGGASPELVGSAAQEALRRLQAGERRLAIHRRCGTTLLAGQLALALTFLAVLLLTQQLSFLPFFAGILAAALLGPRISPLLQRFVTTDARVDGIVVDGVEQRPGNGHLGLVSFFMLGPVYVRTRTAAGGQRPAEPRSDNVTIITGDRDEIPAGRYRVH